MDKLTKAKGFGNNPVGKTKEGGVTYLNDLIDNVAELFLLGLLEGNFYTTQEEMIEHGKGVFQEALDICPDFATKCAIYSSQEANLKLIPTIWMVYISTLKDKTLFKKSFPKVIRNFNMLYDFMEICRKGNIRKGMGRAVKKAVNDRFIDMINDYHATRSRAVLSEIAKTTRPYSEDAGFQNLMKYVSRGELSFPRAVALKTVVQGLQLGHYTENMDMLVRKHGIQLEEVKHSVGALDSEGKKRLYGTLYSKLSYTALILNLVALERVFAVRTDSSFNYEYGQSRVIETSIPGDIIDMVCERISDEKAYEKSHMLPFTLINASKMVVTPEFKDAIGKLMKKVSVKAFDIDENCEILVGVDTSDSMSASLPNGLRCVEIATLMGSMIKKAHVKTRVCAVASFSKEVDLASQWSVFDMANSIKKTNVGYGTEFEQIMKHYRGEKYVILVTDNEPADRLEKVWISKAKKQGARLIIWQISTSGHKISLDKSVTYVRGYSDRILKLIKSIIENKGNQIELIESIEV